MANETRRKIISGPDWLSGKAQRDPESVEIRRLCERAGMPEVADRLIFAGLSLEEVQETLIDALAAAKPSPAMAA